MDDDFELLKAWRAGDEAAASRLIRRHFGRVYQFFRSKLDNDVEDLTQRTFMACVESRDRVETTSFRAYVLGVAHNLLLMHLRTKMRRDRRFDLTDVSAVDFGDSPSRLAAGREEQRLLLAGLRRIPMDLQIAVELFYWEDMTAGEIATVLAIPEGTVRSRLRRAKELLKEEVGKLGAAAEHRDSTVTNLEHWARSLRGKLGRNPE